jgi:ketosteroid isomerase-like protein
LEVSLPRQLAESYVEIINRGAYAELGSLFADDAVFLTPNDGPVLEGRDAIREFYESFLGKLRPRIRIASYFEDGNECVFELEARLGESTDYVLGAIDHFTLDDQGRAIRLVVFTRVSPPS